MKASLKTIFSKKVNMLIGIIAGVVVAVLCVRGLGELRIYIAWSERFSEYFAVFNRVHQSIMEIIAMFHHR